MEPLLSLPLFWWLLWGYPHSSLVQVLLLSRDRLSQKPRENKPEAQDEPTMGHDGLLASKFPVDCRSKLHAIIDINSSPFFFLFLFILPLLLSNWKRQSAKVTKRSVSSDGSITTEQCVKSWIEWYESFFFALLSFLSVQLVNSLFRLIPLPCGFPCCPSIPYSVVFLFPFSFFSFFFFFFSSCYYLFFRRKPLIIDDATCASFIKFLFLFLIAFSFSSFFFSCPSYFSFFRLWCQ
ncbi:hypothetical protein ASPWEDRAFT_658740 [Aspergillus wentii DTO 134E9]|uniref:Uncharacterized protein n=1 Tax=Aspergillus wentii DTO 134E9 TaxID=1073089 RepID=A0A1L9RBM7_ASPWE|nr:uncharacterized protein ASPWEDRAFT_658740 [Aspergillus wentii DTO 134E9]OJJ32326.1 hypothetical protein ASPWEDRAFT_658740 [Aspergillus wentii DTO 134E9]